jgi:ribonuclease HI/DNA-binding MarR family transcriptional regulator
MSLFSDEKKGEAKGKKGKGEGLSVIVQFDGGSRGNPGPAGIGVTLTDEDGTPLYEMGEFLGNCTNNVAEYTALVRGLAAAKLLGAAKVTIKADSELVVRQINGIYKVKSPDLKPLFQRAMALIDELHDVKVVHVYREKNERADELANLAMDRAALGGGLVKIEPLGPLADAVAGFGKPRAPRGNSASAEAPPAVTGISSLLALTRLLRAAEDLSSKELEALLLIAESPGRTQVELSQEMQLSDAAIYRIIADGLMLRHHFVAKSTAESDDETRAFVLTKAGDDFVRKLKATAMPQ